MYYNARYYDALIGRFAQPDTLIPNVYDPQYLNRYSYVRNNPVRYTDPDGHCGPLCEVAFSAGQSFSSLVALAFGGTASSYVHPSPRQLDASFERVANSVRGWTNASGEAVDAYKGKQDNRVADLQAEAHVDSSAMFAPFKNLPPGWKGKVAIVIGTEVLVEEVVRKQVTGQSDLLGPDYDNTVTIPDIADPCDGAKRCIRAAHPQTSIHSDGTSNSSQPPQDDWRDPSGDSNNPGMSGQVSYDQGTYGGSVREYANQYDW
jgi:hypothetical protein